MLINGAGREFIIKDTHRGLYYEDGKLTKVLEAGRYKIPPRSRLLKRLPTVECLLVDVRERELTSTATDWRSTKGSQAERLVKEANRLRLTTVNDREPAITASSVLDFMPCECDGRHGGPRNHKTGFDSLARY